MSHETDSIIPLIQQGCAAFLKQNDLAGRFTLHDVVIKNGEAFLSLETPVRNSTFLQKLQQELGGLLQGKTGLKNVTLSFMTTSSEGASHRPLGGSPSSDPTLPDVKAVIAIASGKGGVGKSTTALNLACGFTQHGLKTGLLDADIYGPSLPSMLGTSHKPEIVSGKLIPIEKWGLKTMSIGYLVDETQALIWRGPMVMGAITQLLDDVEWGELDVMVVDLPPGTGDAQLTLTKKLGAQLKKGGAVIVSTPQDIALLDARRAITLFERTETPVLGLIENMSYFCCPHCNEPTAIFGHGGVKTEAAKLGLPFLGEIPLSVDIRQGADEGTPIILADPDSEEATTYRNLAGKLAHMLEARRS
ncbi:Mrp/NBP35 family ATP-binding protein [Acetobacteraceae bacterium ESL0709]|nr:Mrp/NBP35 family ATP-binding protein [Acetobacteraceae bacterium ESL0697]MDF7678757.1 Mrp/NBP35 family ATP-binding protein [Acetobacteraceae bacterium ESL0709]